MGTDIAVERFRQVQRIRRAYYAADDRKDHEAIAKLENELTLAEEIESATPPSSDEGATLKLKTAARYAYVSACSENGIDYGLVLVIERIARAAAARRNRITLPDLIALRAMLPQVAIDFIVYEPLLFAVEWWSRPRSVLTVP